MPPRILAAAAVVPERAADCDGGDGARSLLPRCACQPSPRGGQCHSPSPAGSESCTCRSLLLAPREAKGKVRLACAARATEARGWWGRDWPRLVVARTGRD
jgi:hypothetical protein